MSRRLTRELAFKFVFRYEFIKDPEISVEIVENFYEDNIDRNKLDDEYFIRVVKGVYENLAEIDSYISKCSLGWKISRISKTDLAILRIAVYEAMMMDDIPVSVAINEAIELSKIYSPEDASSFINGLLSKVCAGRS